MQLPSHVKVTSTLMTLFILFFVGVIITFIFIKIGEKTQSISQAVLRILKD